VPLHFRRIHDPVFDWLFGTVSLPTVCYGDVRSYRQLLWRGYAAVVGGIIIVAVWTTDRGRSAVIAGGVSTCGGSADRRSTDSGSTDADRHARAYTTVNATPIDTAAVDTTASAICGGIS
jgi:hypothetical protein